MTQLKGHSYNLVVVAHPDDETLFMGGTLLTQRTRPWMVVCVTDGNGDGNGRDRRRQFQKAMQQLGVKHHHWIGLPDIYERRLKPEQVIHFLTNLTTPNMILTHGPIGEYGHPHHQDVSQFVHQAFRHHPRLYSVAYNCAPERVVKLTTDVWEKKAQILSDIYGGELGRFVNYLPASFAEGFTKVDPQEVDAIYETLTKRRRPKPGVLKTYAWYAQFLESHLNSKDANLILKRPF